MCLGLVKIYGLPVRLSPLLRRKINYRIERKFGRVLLFYFISCCIVSILNGLLLLGSCQKCGITTRQVRKRGESETNNAQK